MNMRIVYLCIIYHWTESKDNTVLGKIKKPIYIFMNWSKIMFTGIGLTS